MAALAAIGSLGRALGDLDRVTAWLRVFGMVNVAPGFTQVAGVVNGFSETLIEVFGPEVGGHARSAVGMAELPFRRGGGDRGRGGDRRRRMMAVRQTKARET
ncbi:MAG TPA: RidA family protein [Longimicrobium sp.]|nr:RidA family protein [Longimicrobium sp.]